MEPNGKKYWFPAKRYGWGWGVPNCWQGWTVMGIWLVLLVAGGTPLLIANIVAFIIYVILLSVLLTFICWLKGEPPSWRWGKK